MKANKKAGRALRTYLTETGAPDINFENFTAEMLAETLSTFYFNAKTVYGQIYKISSLEGLGHGLNRVLQGPPKNRNIDIIKDPEFHGANDAFKICNAGTKSAGKGEKEHHPLISDADLKKLYDNMNTATPYQLLTKVLFDIHFYFFGRGKHAFYDKRYICCQKSSKYWFGICYKKGGRVEQETSGTGQIIIFCSLTVQGTQNVLWLHSRKCWVSYIHSVIVFGKDQETFFIRRILFGSTINQLGPILWDSL